MSSASSRGPEPFPRVFVSGGLRAATLQYGAQIRTAALAGFPNSGALNNLLNHPFALSPLTAERLARLAEIVGWKGPLTVEVTDEKQWAEYLAMANLVKNYWAGRS